MDPRVSIVLPVTARAEGLSNCFNSLLRQTEEAFEVIMIPLSASMSVLNQCREMEQKDPRFRLETTNGTRLFQARNTGLEKARAEWVMFMDDSDVLASRALESAFAAAERYQADLVCWNGFLVKDSLIRMPENGAARPECFQTIVDKEVLIIRLYLPDSVPRQYSPLVRSAKGKIFRRKIIEENGIVFYSGLRDNHNLLFVTTYLLSCGNAVFISEYLQRLMYSNYVKNYIFKPDLLSLQMETYQATRTLLENYNVPMRKIEYAYWNTQEKDFILNWMKGTIPFFQGVAMTRIFLDVPIIRECLTNGRGKNPAARFRKMLLDNHMVRTAAFLETFAALIRSRKLYQSELSHMKPAEELDYVSLHALLSAPLELEDEAESSRVRAATTTLDTEYPADELIMIKRGTMPTREPDLPAGLYWNERPELIRSQWIETLVHLFPDYDRPKAAAAWDEMEKNNPVFFHRHLYALVSETGTLASVVNIWPSRQVPGAYRLHWMMSSGSYQKQGLARIVIQKALYAFGREFPNQPIYLSTQAQSWPAIRLYEEAGFLSYEEKTSGASAQENQRRWKQARRALWEKEQVAI